MPRPSVARQLRFRCGRFKLDGWRGWEEKAGRRFFVLPVPSSLRRSGVREGPGMVDFPFRTFRGGQALGSPFTRRASSLIAAEWRGARGGVICEVETGLLGLVVSTDSVDLGRCGFDP